MIRRTRISLGLLVAALGMTMLAPAPAQAGLAFLSCYVTVDNPHYSFGANGVIAKVRYSCAGNTSGRLEFDAYLGRKSAVSTGDSYSVAASNIDVYRSVKNGSTGTVYVPAQTKSGVTCSEYYYFKAWSNFKLTGVFQTQYGNESSGSVRPNCPF